MKRLCTVLLCLCLLCSVGCTGLVMPTNENTSEPIVIAADSNTPTPEPTAAQSEEPTADPYHPDLDVLPQLFNAWQDMEYDETEKEMFVFDWDFDGEEETIRVALNWEEGTTTIADGKRSITLDNGAALSNVILIDLDPSTPYVNLVLSIDEASDDYITFALHPEGDAIAANEGKYIACSLNAETYEIVGYENCDLLGTDSGERVYAGENLTPVTEWLECWTPDAEELQNNRENLIEGGVLVHAVRDVPCVIDGDPDMIPAGSYVFRVRFHEDRDSIMVCLEDGRIAEIVFDGTESEDGEGLCWPYLIDGVDQEQYFDNLFYAD